jgi:hypothetical protein
MFNPATPGRLTARKTGIYQVSAWIATGAAGGFGWRVQVERINAAYTAVIEQIFQEDENVTFNIAGSHEVFLNEGEHARVLVFNSTGAAQNYGGNFAMSRIGDTS